MISTLWTVMRRFREGHATEQHVMPVGDLREHTVEDCWCRPVPDEEEPLVKRHNSLDRREAIETGEARLQ